MPFPREDGMLSHVDPLTETSRREDLLTIWYENVAARPVERKIEMLSSVYRPKTIPAETGTGTSGRSARRKE